MSTRLGTLQAKYSPTSTLSRALLACLLAFTPVISPLSQEVEDQVSEFVSEATEERIEQAMEDLLTDIESRISEDALRIQTDHWLVMAEADVFEQLEEEGYLFDRVSELDGLGFLLAEVAAPASFDLSATRAGIYEVIGGDRADIDLNHRTAHSIYFPLTGWFGHRLPIQLIELLLWFRLSKQRRIFQRIDHNFQMYRLFE